MRSETPEGQKMIDETENRIKEGLEFCRKIYDKDFCYGSGSHPFIGEGHFVPFDRLRE